MGLQPTNAGIDFQSRIAACFMTNMLFDIDLDSVITTNTQSKISELRFETKDKIDDLVIITSNSKKIYMQIKRSINLSENKNSDFFGVCKQFVKQFVCNNSEDFAYILVTSNNASKLVTEKLRRILDSIRTAQSLSVLEDFNDKEKDVFDKIRNNITNIYLNIVGKPILKSDLQKLLKRVYIEVFDIEKGQSYEKTIKTILYSNTDVKFDLFWSNLISLALSYASNRQIITRDKLHENLQIYLTDNRSFNKQNIEDETNVQNVVFQGNFFESEMDYVVTSYNEELLKLLIDSEKEIKDNNVIFIIALYRFDDFGKRTYKYISPDGLLLTNGIRLEVIYRSATLKGVYRYIESNEFKEVYSDYQLVVLDANDCEEGKSFIEIHSQFLKKCVTTNTNSRRNCLNCGKAVYQEETYICELDDDSVKNDAGLIHKECIIPVNRVIGIVQRSDEEDFRHLKYFDSSLWVRLLKDGQFFLGGIQKINQRISRIAVQTDRTSLIGNYCVKVILENGSYQIVMQRGKTHRFSKKNAEKFVLELNKEFKKGNEQNNPLCYSSESLTFSNYDNLVSLLGDQEEFIACVRAEIIKYNESSAKLYEKCKNYYAPLIYLSIDEEPLIIKGLFPIFTDPLDVHKILNTWLQADICIKDYEIVIIKDDNEFNLIVIEMITRGIRPMIDVRIGRNGELISGYLVHTMSELELSHKR
ncbi:MAG: hypothetical protein HY818_11300 [Acetobacterium woodii]|nr:hypothetical protein [Acetobacterium woodii]